MKINSIDKPNQKRSVADRLGSFMYKLGGSMEIMIIILFWILVFKNIGTFDGFNREQIITYILVGGMIGIIGGYMLNRIIVEGISRENIDILITNPYKYFFRVLKRLFKKTFFLFLFSFLLQVLLLYYLVDNIVINKDINYWIVILIMIFLSLVSEFLMFYLFRILFIKNIESKEFYKVINRLKNIFSGRYFPLSMLGVLFLNISMSLPFAYSFFVPTQLYLKEIELEKGIKGLFIQIFWIIVFYVGIRFFWNNRNKKEKEKKWRPEFREFKNQ